MEDKQMEELNKTELIKKVKKKQIEQIEDDV
jgi:hypothetical protein